VRGVFLCVLTVGVLTGCTSNVQMADGKGQAAECRTTFFGVIGTLVAASAQQTCIDEYQKKGFHQVATASSPSTAPTGQAKQP
jgi:hypothetical protein